MSKRTLFVMLSVLALGACGGPGQNATVPEAQPAGATSESIGEHTVHFSAMTTDQLTPDVARAFNIVRSKNRAMLNVSVIRNSDGASRAGKRCSQSRQPYRPTQKRHDA